MAVTTCSTFELVVLKRGKSTLEEGMLFPRLIDRLTPPSQALWAAKLGYLPRMMASAIYCAGPEGLPGCQFCSVRTVVYESHAPALDGHIRSLAEDGLMAELASSEVGFSVTGTTVGPEHLPGWGSSSRGWPPRGESVSCFWRHQPILLCSCWTCWLALSTDTETDTAGLWTTLWVTRV